MNITLHHRVLCSHIVEREDVKRCFLWKYLRKLLAGKRVSRFRKMCTGLANEVPPLGIVGPGSWVCTRTPGLTHTPRGVGRAARQVVTSHSQLLLPLSSLTSKFTLLLPSLYMYIYLFPVVLNRSKWSLKWFHSVTFTNVRTLVQG